MRAADRGGQGKDAGKEGVARARNSRARPPGQKLGSGSEMDRIQ